MRRLIILTTLLTTLFSSCHSQTEEEKKKVLDEAVKKALQEFADHPTHLDSTRLDRNIIKHLKDSGRIENGNKEGFWIEYSLDTSRDGQTAEIVIGDKRLPFTPDATLQKETGSYLKGKRSGTWTLYQSYDKNPPLSWERMTETTYNLGQKNGRQIIFSGNDTIYITTLVNGIENGMGKIFDTNYPHKLQKIFNAVNGQNWLVEGYFLSGQLQVKYIDTILYGQKGKYCKEYFENGNLKTAGFYTNDIKQYGTWTQYYENGKPEMIDNRVDTIRDGNYKYFHDNGQLWTERVYKNDKTWNVISNFDRHGNKKDRGTLKNGTGTLKMYDKDGNLTETATYKDGVKIK